MFLRYPDDQAQFIIYADNTSLFLTSDDADILIRMKNIVLNTFFFWSEVNGLEINALMSKMILLRPVNKLMTISCPLKLGVTEIEIVPQHKTLGVYFSEDMSWNFHNNYLI